MSDVVMENNEVDDKVDSVLIKKILCEMKSNFNQDESENNEMICEPVVTDQDNTEVINEPVEENKEEENKQKDDVKVKRSTRRTSRDLSKDSVLQNAIARKEKSFSSLNPPEEKPQRRSTRLSPGASKKIKIVISDSENGKIADSDENSTDEVQKKSQVSETRKPPRLKEFSSEDEQSNNHYQELKDEPKVDETDTGVEIKGEIQESNSSLVCTCETLSSLYGTNQSVCQAVDSYENKLYLCCNDVSPPGLLTQPSLKIPYLQFCDSHLQRIFSHNMCPNCGFFCTSGVFNVCSNKHSFHKECGMFIENEERCPHCCTENFSLYHFKLGKHPLVMPVLKQVKKRGLPIVTLNYENAESPKEITSNNLPLPEKEVIDKLLKVSITSNTRYSYRNMYQAAKSGDAEKLLAMLASGLNPNREEGCACALHAAAAGGHLAAVLVLTQAGANINALDKSDHTPLMLAAMNRHNNVVKFLVKAGAYLPQRGADGMIALHLAAKQGNLEGVQILLSATKSTDLIDTIDDGRWTPLVWAAENNHSQIVRYLLEKNAEAEIRDSELNIALHWSAFAGSMQITESLINYGSNINLQNIHGDTPLHIAARQAADDCVMLLLARGARTDIMNKAGQYPKDCVLNPDSYCYAALELNTKMHKIKLDTTPNILSNDISRGREVIPIQCINNINDDPLPTDYTYITKNCFKSQITIDIRITSLKACNCEDMCFLGCLCGEMSKKCWYTVTGALSADFNYNDPPILFECNQACKCNTRTCKNRVVQKGVKAKLEIFKTKDKSWSVKSLAEIPKGTFVCEFIGEIISDLEADTREDDSYIFELGKRGGDHYCLDAKNYGNVSRFINHSCRPNLAPVEVFIEHQDLHFPRIAFFAAQKIEPNEELSYDYGPKFWNIKKKQFKCHCNEEHCLYSIEITENGEKKENTEETPHLSTS